MPSLTELRENLKFALKSGDQEKAGVLRMLLAELYNREKEKYAKDTETQLDESEIISVIQKEAKKRKDALELFRKGDRPDLVSKEERELKIVEAYLPRQLTPREIAAEVDALISGGYSDFNSLMREAMQKFKGKADGREVARIVKEKLQ